MGTISIFKGGEVLLPGNTAPGPEIGLFICNQYFAGGSIAADITFNDVSVNSTAGIVFNYDTQTQNSFVAALGSSPMYAIRHQVRDKWTPFANAGPMNGIEGKRVYHLKVYLFGSLVTMEVNGVEVLRTVLPVSLPRSQVGLFCVSKTEISTENVAIDSIRPQAFVVM